MTITLKEHDRIVVSNLFLRSWWRERLHAFFPRISPVKTDSVEMTMEPVASSPGYRETSIPKYGFTIVLKEDEGTVTSDLKEAFQKRRNRVLGYELYLRLTRANKKEPSGE